MKCEICGNEDAKCIISVEGTMMSVGEKCSKMGKFVKNLRTNSFKNTNKNAPKQQFKQSFKAKDEPIFIIKKDYSNLVRLAREKKGLKQEELAKAIHEKESVLHAIESGHREPRLDLAKKLENYLKIKLVEQYEETAMKFAAGKTDTLTIGHMINFKTKKRG